MRSHIIIKLYTVHVLGYIQQSEFYTAYTLYTNTAGVFFKTITAIILNCFSTHYDR